MKLSTMVTENWDIQLGKDRTLDFSYFVLTPLIQYFLLIISPGPVVDGREDDKLIERYGGDIESGYDKNIGGAQQVEYDHTDCECYVTLQKYMEISAKSHIPGIEQGEEEKLEDYTPNF